MASLWRDGAPMDSYPALSGDVNADVLVIGGGMVGALCAHFLQRAGARTVLVEAQTLGSGTTGNTTAKITAQHGLLYADLLKRRGREIAQAYLDANLRAIEQYAALAAGIPCDFERRDAYVYCVDDSEAIEREVCALRALGYPAHFQQSIELPFAVAGAVRFPDQAQFHPLLFLSGIARGLTVYAHTPVLSMREGAAYTARGVIRAEKMVVATHFPFLNRHGGYFLRMYQHRSYAIALENAARVDGMYLETGETGLSFRGYGERLILVGGDHRTGKRGGNWAPLRAFAKEAYPLSRETHAWAAQDCVTLDETPYIGRYSARTPDLYVATGFNKWGMTGAMVAAQLLADQIAGKESPYQAVFTPSRGVPLAAFLQNGLAQVPNYFPLSSRRCPHLGCALKWNGAEHTWDCPCHGSRFAREGQLIDNPATGDLRDG